MMMSMRQKGKTSRVFIILVLILVFAAGAAAGYFIKAGEDSAPQNEEQIPDEDSGQRVQENQEEDYMVISTEYGDLYYPRQWEDWLKTEQSMEGESLNISFSAQIHDVEYPMFQVTVGESGETEVGELTDSSGVRRTVYIKMDELQEGNGLSEEEQQRFYAMQEGLNDIIDHLK